MGLEWNTWFPSYLEKIAKDARAAHDSMLEIQAEVARLEAGRGNGH